MAIGVSQDLCSGLCHATHSSDNPERRWDGEMTKFAPKQSLSLHMLGTKPQKMPSGFYSNLQRHQKWGKLLDGCGRLTVALAYNGRGEEHPFGGNRFKIPAVFLWKSFSFTRCQIFMLSYSWHPKIHPYPAGETVNWGTWTRLPYTK